MRRHNKPIRVIHIDLFLVLVLVWKRKGFWKLSKTHVYYQRYHGFV